MGNNIPAFPRPVSVTPTGLESNQAVAWDQQGMTLLDYFAAHFAPAVMKQFPIQQYDFQVSDKDKELSINNRRKFIASQSYALAKMFLEVRKHFDTDKERE